MLMENTPFGQPQPALLPIKKNNKRASPYLKKKKELLNYLQEQNILTEQEAQKLRWYRHFHYKSKKDMDAPRFSGSQIGSIASRFGETSRYFTEEEKGEGLQTLLKFRALRRQLFTKHKNLIIFAEALFDYPQNDLDFYQSWLPEDQREKATALKKLSNLIK